MEKKQGLMGIIFIVLVIWLILFRQGVGIVPQQELLLASLIYFICSMPLIIFLYKQRRYVPYMPVFSIFFFVNFSLGIFNDYGLFEAADITHETIIKVLNLVLSGIVSMFVAFYTPLLNFIGKTVAKIRLTWDPKRAYQLAFSLTVFGSFFHYLYSATAIPVIYGGLVAFLSELSRLGIVIFYLLLLKNQLRFFDRIMLWGFFSFRLLLDLSSGSTALVLSDFITLFFIYFYHYKRIPWVRVAALCLIFVITFGARDEYRNLTWFSGEYGRSGPIRKSIVYVGLIVDSITGKKKEHLDDYKKLSYRTNMLITFSRIVELTPEYVPYWGGHTYSMFFSSFIPRFLYPGKPPKTLGQDFGHRYELLEPDDLTTSYNLPVLIEMYVNFGLTGILTGMFLLGLFFRLFYEIFNHPEAGEGGAVLSTMVFVGLFNLESDFSLLFGNTLQYIILFYIIIRFKIVKVVPSGQNQGP